MGYQDEDAEREIVRRADPEAAPALVRRAVRVVRATRTHPDVRVGSSVRGAIDLVIVADRLATLRDTTATDDSTGLDAALAALSGRIRIREGGGRSAEELVRELWAALAEDPTEADGSAAEGDTPPGGGTGKA